MSGEFVDVSHTCAPVVDFIKQINNYNLNIYKENKVLDTRELEYRRERDLSTTCLSASCISGAPCI